MDASIFRGENFEHSSGIRARVLISKPIHMTNHFWEDSTMNVPSTIVKNNRIDIVRDIELEGNLTLNNLIIS